MHDGGDFAAILKYLQGLSDADLTGLENLGSQCTELFDRPDLSFAPGSLISSGIRLYRIALPYLLSRSKDAVLDVTLSLNDLPPEQKGTYLGFFQSAYVWNNYLHLMHPTNVARINEMKLRIRFNPESDKWGERRIKLIIPEKWEMADSELFGFPLNDAEIEVRGD